MLSANAKETAIFEKTPVASGSKGTEYKQIVRNIALLAFFLFLVPNLVLLATALEKHDTILREKIYNDLGGIVDKHRMEIDSFLREKTANIQSIAFFSTPEELQKKETLKVHLAHLRHIYGTIFEDLGLISSTGELVNYVGPLRLRGVNYGEEDWFLKAIQEDHAISDVFLGFRGMPHFIITVRMKDGRGATWLLRSTIDLESFNTIVRNIKIGQSGFATIINKKGVLQTRLLQDLSPHLATYKKLPTIHAGNRLVSYEARDEEGERQIYVAGFLNRGDWMLIAQQGESDALSDLACIRKMGVFLFTAYAFLMAAMLIYASKAFLRIMEHKQTEKTNHPPAKKSAPVSFGALNAEIVQGINGPLTMMQEATDQLAGLLMEEDKQKIKNWNQLKASLAQIQSQVQGCRKGICKLLALAQKTESGPDNIQINDIIREILPMCESRTKHTKIDIEIRLSPSLPRINAFRGEIQQSILNLANNAIDAMETDGGLLSFQTGCRKGLVEIQISDTGPGIPETNLQKIFEPFFTTKPAGKSAGFGIPMCYGIITAMRGHIEVESITGAGTTFRILLPAGAQDTEQ